MSDVEPFDDNDVEATAKVSPRKRIRRDESGLAVVWMTITLLLLLGVAAFAVDLVHAILVQQQAQNAADSAALGGVVFLPGDTTSAYNHAIQVAGDNGFSTATGATVTPLQQVVKSRLQVTVSEHMNTIFAKVLGFNSLNITRTATADYDQPVSMGSPSNTFGNQPDCNLAPGGVCTNTTGADNPQLWFNVAGPDSTKQNGDAYTARLCDIDGSHAADNCPGNSNGNADYDGNGYTYVVHNTSASGQVDIQAFDPVFVHVGDTCTDTALGNLFNAVSTSQGAAAAARYATGPGSQYCTGDAQFTYGVDPYKTTTPPTTVYSVTWDPGTPWTTSDDVPICTRTFKGFSDAQTAYADATNGRPYFRQWVDITKSSSNSTGSQCNALLPAKQGTANGDYLLTITTASGSGHNRGSMRACTGSCPNGANASSLSIYAKSRMALYANATGANTQFYLARVLPGAAGRTLLVSLFDVGDAGQAGSLQILPPADDTAQSVFDNCQLQLPPGLGVSTKPPYSLTYSNTSVQHTCQQDNVYSGTGWNGQWVLWKVPIPPNYTCNQSLPSGCWIKLRFSYPAGASVSDTTTWTATLSGNPVRLVQ